MATPGYSTVQSGNTMLDRIQGALAKAIAPLAASQIVSGSLLTGVVLSSGSTPVSHKLGRKLTGWVVVRQRADASIYDTQDSNSSPELTLQLTSSAAVTVDLWVF